MVSVGMRGEGNLKSDNEMLARDEQQTTTDLQDHRVVAGFAKLPMPAQSAGIARLIGAPESPCLSRGDSTRLHLERAAVCRPPPGGLETLAGTTQRRLYGPVFQRQALPVACNARA